MAVIKCKMCGGDLELVEGSSVAECAYCGSKQTVPQADDEKKMTLFARAGRLLRANEFDKAAGVFESLVADFPEEAEAYWGLVLCRYGIEYVDDPATGRKVPTCHRSSFDSVLEDSDFEQACENADAVARRQYQEEARQIEELRRGIIEVSGREEPYDIFICYKETDENGQRTVDSVLAQDVYDALTEKGYRVFFSRISLEDKLGTEYEPYIFAALNSAKVMLAFGTDYEYYNAVWVKNEWSRYLKLMAKDKEKHLIPCYKGIDAYDMPKEFQRLQAQDLGKVGAVQDLLRGIEKLIGKKGGEEAAPAQPVVQQIVQGSGPNAAALLQRGNLALEDGEWDKAKDFYDQVLNMDAQSAAAYLGLVLADAKLHRVEEIGELDDAARTTGLQSGASFAKFTRFAAEEEKERLASLLSVAEEKAKKRRAALQARRSRIAPVQQMLSAGAFHTVGLRSNGTVATAGRKKEGQCKVDGWTDIVSVAAGGGHTAGLRYDGTVVAVGNNNSGQCVVGCWTDIVSVAAGAGHTVGLRSDGTVVAAGDNEHGQCGVGGLTDIVAVAAGVSHTVGLRSDSTVIAVGSNKYGECDVGDWTDIVSVAAGSYHTVALRSDGTAIAVGWNEYGQCDVDGWADIVAVAAGWEHTVGLRSDGTVAAAGDNEHGQCGVGGLTDIVAVAAGVSHTVGLRSDGTVIAVGKNESGQCGVGGWKLFNSLDTLKQERITVLTLEQYRLQTELSNLKGIFSGKRRKEIEARLAEIAAELKRLQ